MEQQKQQKKHGIVRRAASGTAKAWAYSIGLTGLVNTGKRLGGGVGQVVAHARHQLNDKPENHRRETFEQAVDRLGLDEEHLIKQAKAFNTRSLSWLASMVMASAWLAYLALSGTLTPQAFILWLGLMFMTGAKTITWRFRYSQICHQELFSFGSFLRTPGRW